MNLPHRSPRAVVVILCIALLLPGCLTASNQSTPGTTPDATVVAETPHGEPTEEAPETGGALVVALPEEPNALNFSLTDQPSALWVLSAVDARMIRVRSDGSYEPVLLAEIPAQENGGISEDGQTWTIQFRPDLTWSDGNDLDGRDFLFTWRTMVNPDFPTESRAGWQDIQDVKLSADRLTAVITLKSSPGTFMESVLAGASDDTSGFLLPEHAFEDIRTSEIPRSPYGDEGHIGSGPFLVAKWEPGDQLILEPNPHYFDQPARLDRIVFRFGASEREVMSNLSIGEVDLAVALPEAATIDLRQNPDLAVHVTPKAGAVMSYAFNLNDPEDLSQPHPLFADRAVRKAIAIGFDRAQVIDELLVGQATVGVTLLDYTRWFANDLRPYPYDPELAQQILDEADWQLGPDGVRTKNGVRLSFTHSTPVGDGPASALRERIQKAFIQDMAHIGVEVEARNFPERQLTDDQEPDSTIRSRRFDMIDLIDVDRSSIREFVQRFATDETTTDSTSGGNLMGYSDQLVDQALTAVERTADPARQYELMVTAQHQIYQDIPVIPIYDHLEVDASRTYVRGLEPGPISGLWWNVAEWWVEREEVAD